MSRNAGKLKGSMQSSLKKFQKVVH